MSAAGDVATGPGWELRCGDYREVLADVESVSAVITDPPYGERTHAGQRHGRRSAAHGNGRASEAWVSTRGLEYEGWTAEDVATFCRRWEHVPGWVVPLTSHDLIGPYQEAARSVGRYAFAPVPCVIVGMNVRLAGDGPSSWAVYAVPNRPRALRHWGTLDGAYHGSAEPGVERAKLAVAGSKPLWLMRALIRDYTRPGDLVCDPCAGGGTTLLAAVIEGRRAIGAELSPETFDKAVARLKRGYTPSMEALWAEEGDSAAE